MIFYSYHDKFNGERLSCSVTLQKLSDHALGRKHFRLVLTRAKKLRPLTNTDRLYHTRVTNHPSLAHPLAAAPAAYYWQISFINRPSTCKPPKHGNNLSRGRRSLLLPLHHCHPSASLAGLTLAIKIEAPAISHCSTDLTVLPCAASCFICRCAHRQCHGLLA